MGCLAGKRNDEIAAELDIRPGTVGVWRRRFAEEGMKGLRDQHRPVKPPRYPVTELRNRLLEQIEQPPPAGLAIWDDVPWRKRWVFPMMRSGGYCAKTASNSNSSVIVRGA